MEDCFIKQSALKPRHAKLYWMGLATGEQGAVWPNFTWIDKGNAVYNGDYQHWGALVNASGARIRCCWHSPWEARLLVPPAASPC